MKGLTYLRYKLNLKPSEGNLRLHQFTTRVMKCFKDSLRREAASDTLPTYK
ncbi:hypothetical protein E2C01_099428 [Portunus trituberculatus]|uniref:Uncharacterized protein n=1 Tax=Portunus trituberculatus TaxID=210409 RepID=A0A5B7KAR7_PORTR|nr:hypothetical protein [Portunus trituberculatus]